DAQEHVAVLPDQPGDALSLAADDDGEWALEVACVIDVFSFRIQPGHPESGILELFQRAGEILDAHYGQESYRAGAGFCHYGSDLGGPTLRNKQRFHTGAFGYTDDGAQVVRIFDAVQNADRKAVREPLFAQSLAPELEEIRQLPVGDGRKLRHHS